MTATLGRAASLGPADLLDLADAILDGSITVPGSTAARGAAVIARQVLEETVERRCRELAGIIGRPTFRSQLVLLRELGDPVVAERARVAWDGLSRACHHHSYELQPMVAEVRCHILKAKEVVENMP